ncbi:hypothetical protein V5799_018622 [Amblyomma americanum]|uniref:Uncharacterized protein n=1 Tax=Amblyomma americanum TaxID=6943 RepID=A0AAQ4EZJ7_AMBAM
MKTLRSSSCDLLATERRRHSRGYSTSRTMKFLKCPVVVIVTGLACFHTSSSNELSKQMTEWDKITQARKLLREREPLFLLWGGEIPSKLSNRTCWRTTYVQMGPNGEIRHSIEGAVFGEPSGQGGVDQMTKLDSVLTLKEVDSIATLVVDPIGKAGISF